MRVFLRNSLPRKISLLFMVVASSSGLLFAYLFLLTFQSYRDRSTQLLYWPVAAELLLQHRHLLEPRLKREELRKAFALFHGLNPELDPFLLDSEGAVVVSRGPLGELSPVPLEPLKLLLDIDGYPSKAIYGSHPHTFIDEPSVFSVATTTYDGRPGYLYVVHRSMRSEAARKSVGDVSAWKGAMAMFAVVFALSLGIGVALIHYITRHMRYLTAVMSDFMNGNYERRAKRVTDDELGLYAATFNKMADTIAANLDQLREVDAARRMLVANASHDLRTPLSVMRTQLETLELRIAEMSEDEIRKLLARSLQVCTGMESLLTELFELSKLSAPGYQPNLEEFALEEMVDGILQQFQPQAAQKQLQLRVIGEEALPHVVGDPRLIVRVLMILLENAIKFTPEQGAITVALYARPDAVELSVTDTGIGIPSEEQAAVFDSFYRADNAREIPGSGLGLATARKIIEVHNAQLKLESVPGGGSKFSFELLRYSQITDAT